MKQYQFIVTMYRANFNEHGHIERYSISEKAE